MKKEHLIRKLRLYNRTCTRTEQTVSIKSGLGLYVDVVFHENGQITLRDLFKGYNILSGFIRLTVKAQLIYTSLGYVVFSVLTGYILYTTPPLRIFLSVVYLFSSVMIITWMLYYVLRAEAEKRQITAWLDEAEKDTATG